MKHPSRTALDNLSASNQRETNPKLPFPILAVDYGEKYSGLAWSPDGVVALPLQVVQSAELTAVLKRTIQEKSITQLVWGLPVGNEGNEAPLGAEIRELSQQFNLPTTLVDERGSTQATLSRDNQRRDDLAAAKILEFFLSQK